MIDEILKGVRKLVADHTDCIIEKKGAFHSDHEFYGVLKEEQDEVKVEYIRALDELERIWAKIKESDEMLDKGIIPQSIYWELLASESIQCAAVCEKLRRQKEDEKRLESNCS